MNVGAIVTVPAVAPASKQMSDGVERSRSQSWKPPCARTEVLGESLLTRLVTRLRASGVNEVTVIDETVNSSSDFTAAQNSFWFRWDEAITRYLDYKAKTLLLIRLGPYVEIDVPDFLRAHRETSSPMTQAFDRNGALDLVAIDGKELSHGKGSNRSRLRSLLSRQQKYAVSGYSNRLRTFQDFRRLVVDALTGSAALRPCGTEVRPNVWLGEGAVIDESARVVGPAFIGCNTRIGAGSVITGNSSIERNCEVDCGTTVHQSCILPGTYLGLGIKVKNCVVAGQSLFHLGRNLQLHVEDSRIIGDGEKSGRFMEAARTFMRKGSVRREQSCQPTRPDLHL